MIAIVRDIDHPDRNGLSVFCANCGSRIVRIYTSRPEFYAACLAEREPELCPPCKEKEAEGAKADSR